MTTFYLHNLSTKITSKSHIQASIKIVKNVDNLCTMSNSKTVKLKQHSTKQYNTKHMQFCNVYIRHIHPW